LFGCCAVGNTSVVMHNPGNTKVFNLLQELTEPSKAQIMPGIRGNWVKSFLPLIIMGSVRLEIDKMDKLGTPEEETAGISGANII